MLFGIVGMGKSTMKPFNKTRRAPTVVVVFIIWCLFLCVAISGGNGVFGVQILSKSKLEKCERSSSHSDSLNCTKKIVINIAVPSGSSGSEASMVAEVVEVEENSTNQMQTLRIPPVITINKSAAYALYELTYIRDVPYKPQEFYVQTRKCQPDADAKVVQMCERLRDEDGHIMEHTQPICCPCGDRRRVPSSCGNFFDKLVKGKANTAHCVRFLGDWFHVFGIGQRSMGFSVQIEVKTGTKASMVVVGPENRTAISDDNFLRVNLIGDFVGYANIPSFEELYLVTPRQGEEGQPRDLGRNFSMWMLLERVRFTLDGLECNKIGVSYEAFNGQPDFCSSPYWSCLHNQLWNFHEADQNRISRNQVPLYGVEGRFERINQHPDLGPHSFSIGITEVLNTNLLIELRADDIDYVYQRSPGKILGITIPVFETLTQFGTAKVTTKNTGEVEASYSLTFDCSKGVTMMEEQFFIMKPNEVIVRSFKLYPTTDQAAKYVCSAILKDSEFNEVDRAECQFTTTATVLDNGTQITPFEPPKTSGSNSLFGSIKDMWNQFWEGFTDFITGKSCRSKCSGFFDFHCHVQYACMSWIVMFGLFLAIFPTVLVLIWLLHQKGLFDPVYDWWEDHCLEGEHNRYREDIKRRRRGVVSIDHYPRVHLDRHHHRHGGGGGGGHRHHNHKHKRSRVAHDSNNVQHHCFHNEGEGEGKGDYYHYLHHVHKEKDKHGHRRSSSSATPTLLHYLERKEEEVLGNHHRHVRKERKTLKRATAATARTSKHRKAAIVDESYWEEEVRGLDGKHSKLHLKRRA